MVSSTRRMRLLPVHYLCEWKLSNAEQEAWTLTGRKENLRTPGVPRVEGRFPAQGNLKFNS